MKNESFDRSQVPPAPPRARADPARGGIDDDAVLRRILPVGRSALAIAAGYLGLLSPLVFPAPFALLLGILAVRDVRRHPSKHGVGRAVFGIVMGAAGSIALIAILWLMSD